MFGDVAAVLVTDAGHRFAGVSIDTGSGTGFCAEHSAVAAMVTAGEYRIAAIVAVWRDELARLYVLPPCGRCREFIRQVHSGNLDTMVLLGGGRSVPPPAGWSGRPVELGGWRSACSWSRTPECCCWTNRWPE